MSTAKLFAFCGLFSAYDGVFGGVMSYAKCLSRRSAKVWLIYCISVCAHEIVYFCLV